MSYSHPLYAQSLHEYGEPRELPHCGGWVIVRKIPGTQYEDAMGCYPLFACHDWRKLYTDLEEMGDDLISVVLVSEPFGANDPDYLRQCFRDVVLPFKEHFVADLQFPLEEIVGRRHRKNARHALRKMHVDVLREPVDLVDQWLDLYNHLVERHNVSGIRAFSKEAFTNQLSIPGTVVLRAMFKDQMVAAQIYFVQGEVAYCHLGAANQLGYDLGAFYALDFYAVEYFADKVHWLDLGGSVGNTTDGKDGLSMYKRGWSTETRTSYLCGRIFNRELYEEILRFTKIGETDYFPAYRKGEFSGEGQESCRDRVTGH